MFGAGFPCSMPLCSPSIMCPYDVPVPQPYPCPVSVPQPYIQNICQPVDFPMQNTIQPVIVPTPVNMPVPHPFPVPIDRPCAVPVPQPVPVPVDRPCAFPVPVCVPVPQPCAVPQPYVVREQVGVPVPMPFPVHVPTPMPFQYHVQEERYYPQYQEECIIEEPIYVKKCRHRRRRCHHSRTPAPAPPIIIPIPIQAPAQEQAVPLQITEYVQDIYPPAQVYTDQVPVGFMSSNSVVQQPGPIQTQHSMQCQPGVILPPAPYQPAQQHIVQQIPTGQVVQRPLSVGGHHSVQTIMSQPNLVSSNQNPVFIKQ